MCVLNAFIEIIGTALLADLRGIAEALRSGPALSEGLSAPMYPLQSSTSALYPQPFTLMLTPTKF